ncbi:hypothetical protein R1flu_010514 [Riccia fluitans]|uniref:Cleavage and polyadenylation specificity factor subunit 3-II n=1 Tax=Riccia fluitans TaxID=41844 RepID=A0ABD1Z570_9MARC
MLIKCVPLGAGQDVGKSCVIVTIGGKNIMFDCGMHMGYQDDRRYPKFSFVSKTGNYTQAISCVIVTLFHLDHIGALPYFTEVCGYEGPIYMTYPTKALAPLMLEDYRRVLVDKKGENELFSAAQIQQCMKRVTAVDLKQTVQVDNDIDIRAYYAGHVLGAAMFYVKVGDDSCVYTGDYNMTPDRHLGAAQIDALQPDLLITESTYATTVRDSKRAREREFLKKVHNCVAGGGKVLIPVFALGRAQELCILLDEYWERMNLKYPIYFSAGLTMQANVYYKLLISWTNQKVKDTYVTRSTFDFKHVSPFDQSQMDAPGPCVLFATPGMLSGGLSLEVFKHWAPSEQNLVVVPGFCMTGTVGSKLVSGKATKLDVDKRSPVDVRCQVHQLSFSAHTDAKGILDLVKHVSPRNVVLLRSVFQENSRGSLWTTKTYVSVDPVLLTDTELPLKLPHVRESIAVEGVVILDEASKLKIIHTSEAPAVLSVKQHDMTFTCVCSVTVDVSDGEAEEFRLQAFDASLKNVAKDTSPQPGGRLQLGISNLNEGNQLLTGADEEGSRKKYRMDVERCLSLNLEKEPEIEDGEELESHGQEDPKGHTSSAANTKRKIRGSGMSRILDINAVPESSSEMEMESAAREPSPPSIPAVAHALYIGLSQLSKTKSFVLEGDMLKSRSFVLRVSPKIPGDSLFTVTPVDQEPRGSPCGANAQNSFVFSANCSWSFEDDHLANRILDILRHCKLRML